MMYSFWFIVIIKALFRLLFFKELEDFFFILTLAAGGNKDCD